MPAKPEPRFALLVFILILSVPTLAPSSGKVLATAAARLWIGHFSISEPGQTQAPWMAWRLDSTRSTEYRIARIDGRTALRADSDQSASALIRKATVDPSEFPVLHWSWRTSGPVQGGSWSDAGSDDFPLRLFLIVERRRGLFSALGGVVAKLGGGFAGQALNYVWSGPALKIGDTGWSPVSERVAMIAAESGQERIGRWVEEKRDWVEDYRRAFGETPGKITAVAVMTDTDDTGGRVTSFFGDIYFSGRNSDSPD